MEDRIMITDAIINIFNGADKRDWELVRNSFHFEVFLDYFSMTNIPGAKVRSEDIITGWSEFLPKFTFTHHILTNFDFALTKANASVFCKGSALHYLPNSEGGDTWTTIGLYDFKLAKIAGTWKVNSMIFSLLFEEGNKTLAAIAKMK